MEVSGQNDPVKQSAQKSGQRDLTFAQGFDFCQGAKGFDFCKGTWLLYGRMLVERKEASGTLHAGLKKNMGVGCLCSRFGLVGFYLN